MYNSKNNSNLNESKPDKCEHFNDCNLLLQLPTPQKTEI